MKECDLAAVQRAGLHAGPVQSATSLTLAT